MGLGTMLALNFLAIGLFLPLGQLVQTALRLNALQSHAERLEDVFRAKAEHLGRPTASGRVSGAVELSRVHFRYGEMSPFGISDVSLRCEAGSVVALVGKSGSGKSTLAKLICGLYQPVSGQILYDGHQAEEWGLENLRRQVGYVPQTPRFFGTQSIRLNIAGLDSTVPLERIEAAARAAAIEAEIRALPLGYDSYLLNDGDAFSGGQKQRIALARALLVEPRILVLDEATSALDTLTEQEVYRTLSGLSCTRLIIAHRLSTIANADHIVVLDQGSVVDQGRHAELLGRCALYRALVQGQGEAP
jgi:ABC-type bacteriocin/lantibiotic exporter with double-glycine peptidase domain